MKKFIKKWLQSVFDKITAIIVDDNKIIQKVINRKVETLCQVVGYGNDGNEGFELYKKLKPEIVLLDITMPNCSGKECLEKIIHYDPKASVIMVSAISDPTTIESCLKIGAKGYLNKEDLSPNNSTLPILDLITKIKRVS